MKQSDAYVCVCICDFSDASLVIASSLVSSITHNWLILPGKVTEIPALQKS